MVSIVLKANFALFQTGVARYGEMGVVSSSVFQMRNHGYRANVSWV